MKIIDARTGNSQGITILARASERPYTSETLLATVDSADWRIRWTAWRDGVITHHVIVDGTGTYTLHVSGGFGDPLSVDSWAGVTPRAVATAEFGL